MDEWARRLANGDVDAFTELYDRCADRLHHYLATRLGSREEASELLQETFLRLWKSRRRLAGVEDPVAYAFITARNESARRMRRRTKHARQAADAETLFEEARQEAIVERERAELAAELLARLDEPSRELIELKIFAGMTFLEIAAVQGLPLGTVATRYRRAVGQLRQWIAEQSR